MMLDHDDAGSRWCWITMMLDHDDAGSRWCWITTMLHLHKLHQLLLMYHS